MSDEGRLEDVIRQIWIDNLPASRELADRLVDYAEALTDGTAKSDDTQSALFAAHRLAGSLGPFGFTDGGAIAATLEAHLKSPTDHPLDSEEFATLAETLREIIERRPADTS